MSLRDFRRSPHLTGALGALLALPLWAGPALADETKGYLTTDQITQLADTAPPAPQAGSPDDLADKARSKAMRGLEDTDRWFLATAHAELRPPVALSHFDCTLGFRLSTANAPRLTALMTRMLHDADGVAERVKALSHRPRPVGDDPTRRACQRLSDAGRKSASYPSGSASAAAAYGEVMADLVPEQAEALRKAAEQVALSRLVCGMHYPRDVEVGEQLGKAAFAAVRQSEAYQSDLLAARAEVAVARAEGQTNPACAAERLALSQPLP